MRTVALAILGLALACGGSAAASRGGDVKQAEYRYNVTFGHGGRADHQYEWSVWCDRLSNTVMYVSEYDWRSLTYGGPCG